MPAFPNFVGDVFAVFLFVVWFWLLMTVFGDLFRRQDIGAPVKVLWMIAVILFSYFGILAYFLTQGRGMSERSLARANEVRGLSTADEIAKLSALREKGALTAEEYARLKKNLVG